MKKALALVTACLLMVMLLAACGGDSSSSSSASTGGSSSSSSSSQQESSSEETPLAGKITFSCWDLETTGYLKTLVDAFTAEYPDIEVEIIDIPAADYTSKLGVDLNGGAAADVFLIKDADTSYSLNQIGHLADLSEFVQKDGIDLSMFNGLAQNFNFDGVQAGMPFRTDYYVLYYNKDIFDAANLDYPTNDMTWTEFEALATELTSGSGTDKVYGAHFHTWQALVENWAVQDGKNTIMGPDYEFMRSAYEMVLRMQDAGVIQDYGTLKSGSIAYGGAFQSGNVAMMPMGTWYTSAHAGRVAAGETDVKNWGVATIPHAEGLAAGSTVGSTTPMAINNASKNKELAWEFIKFACTNSLGTDVVVGAGQIPASVNDAILAKLASSEGMPENLADAYTVKNIVLDRPYVEYVNEVNTMLGEEHSRVMLGEIDVDTFIATITERRAEFE